MLANSVKLTIEGVIMKHSKRIFIFLLLTCILTFSLIIYKLPYYIYRPGGVDPLDQVVQVETGYASEGMMHLVTVSGGQATVMEYLLASMQPFHEIVPLEKVRPEGMTEEEYMQYQLKLMENSQHASIVVAYEAAQKDVKYKDNGIFVLGVIKGMPSSKIVHIGDRIIKVDGRQINNSNDLISYVEQKQPGELIEVQMERENEIITKKIEVAPFPDDENKVGIGIRLVNDTEVEVEPKVVFDSGNIGGPSAGLMFALEMYNQLSEEDITKGYKIAGTGEIDDEGNVHRIGGIDKKVVAADKAGIEIFFAPYENGNEESNYELALQTATKIKSKMEIVPVDTFSDALQYLHNLQQK